jgi:pyruvate/2-oxoglutarate dehydrogenase complex dihydrolipoamide acyltransferase (E2) component
LIEIDHGNDLITRYGHSSKVLVKKGDLVKRGQKIAEVGTTGRSTGPHLHFEVLVQGVPQDPQKFLNAGRNITPPQVAQAAAAQATPKPTPAPLPPAQGAVPPKPQPAVPAPIPVKPQPQPQPQPPSSTLEPTG